MAELIEDLPSSGTTLQLVWRSFWREASSQGASLNLERRESIYWELDIFSLTLGLMGLDELHLRVLATSSENLTEKRNAQKGWAALPCSLECTDHSKSSTSFVGVDTGCWW